MNLISWNISGLRAVLKKGFIGFVKDENPDILCLQETKIDDSFHMNIPGYNYSYFNHAQKKGYSGTAIFSKTKPSSVIYGIKHEEHDKEGRFITAEFDRFYLVNVYTPNSKRDLTRLPYRINWDKAFLRYIESLDKKKPVVLCGDLNVAHKEIDIANPKANRNNAGFTDAEKADFENILSSGFIDTFRVFNDQPRQYTYWIYFANARTRNIGWRIDYFIISKSLKDKLKDAYILSKVLGSDHCPIGIKIDL